VTTNVRNCVIQVHLMSSSDMQHVLQLSSPESSTIVLSMLIVDWRVVTMHLSGTLATRCTPLIDWQRSVGWLPKA